MPELNTYLFFNGNCAEAMRFYERTLGGKLETLMTHAESPIADQTPPGSAEKIMHARLVLDGGVVMASDAPATEQCEAMNGFSVSLVYPTADEAKRVFNALAKDGKVIMALEKTFWAEAFGMLVDRFRTPWMINAAMTSA